MTSVTYLSTVASEVIIHVFSFLFFFLLGLCFLFSIFDLGMVHPEDSTQNRGFFQPVSEPPIAPFTSPGSHSDGSTVSIVELQPVGPSPIVFTMSWSVNANQTFILIMSFLHGFSLEIEIRVSGHSAHNVPDSKQFHSLYGSLVTIL